MVFLKTDIENEKIKLLGNVFNSLSIGVGLVGIAVPMFQGSRNRHFLTPPSSDPILNLFYYLFVVVLSSGFHELAKKEMDYLDIERSGH